MFDTLPTPLPAELPVNRLERAVTTVPFVRNFFATPASGDWSYTVTLSNARVEAAEFYVTNSQGNSPVARLAYTNTLDKGLRTLSGGQYSFQISGPLAIDSDPVPEILVDTDHVIGNISAFLAGPSSGSGVRIGLTLNSVPFCAVEFETGFQLSAGIRGVDLPVMRRGDRLGLSILEVGTVAVGSDLTVLITI